MGAYSMMHSGGRAGGLSEAQRARFGVQRGSVLSFNGARSWISIRLGLGFLLLGRGKAKGCASSVNSAGLGFRSGDPGSHHAGSHHARLGSHHATFENRLWGLKIASGARKSPLGLENRLWGSKIASGARKSPLGLENHLWGSNRLWGSKIDRKSPLGLGNRLWGSKIASGVRKAPLGLEKRLWGSKSASGA